MDLSKAHDAGWITTGLSVGILLLLGLAAYAGYRNFKNSNLSVEDYINQGILKGHVIFLLITLIVLAVGEAIYIASAPTVDNIYMNPISRFSVHLAIMVASIAVTIAMPHRLYQLALNLETFRSSKEKVRYGMAAVFELIIVGILLILTFWLPYNNLRIIGMTFGQLAEVDRAYYKYIWALLPWNDWKAVYTAAGIPLSYDPIYHMRLPVFITYCIYWVIIAISTLDGLIAAKGYIVGFKKNASSANTPSTPIVSAPNAFEQDILGMLKFFKYAYRNGQFDLNKHNNKKNEIKDKFIALGTTDQAMVGRISANMVEIQTRINEINGLTGANMNNAVVASKYTDVKRKFVTFCKDLTGWDPSSEISHTFTR